jgi:hypothetical protein
MNDLIDVLNTLIQNNTEAQKLTDLAIGTVTSTSPLAIQINPNMPPLPEEALLLCDSVKELWSSVEITANFRNDLQNAGITVSDDIIGKVLSVQTVEVGDKVEISSSFKSLLTGAGITITDDIIGEVIRRHNLEVGDKVIMIRVMRGQQFVVLSKV